MKKFTLYLLMFFALQRLTAQNPQPVHHNLNVIIHPSASFIAVTDTISNLPAGETEFSLNAALKLTSWSAEALINPVGSNRTVSDVGMDRNNVSASQKPVELTNYKVQLTHVNKKLIISYEGKIDFTFTQNGEDYARGFSESPGIISDSGIYLAGSTWWIPSTGNDLLTFSLTTELPLGWKTVAQGERSNEHSTNSLHYDTWECASPQEEIFLVAARFNEYAQTMNSGIMAMAFLRTPDGPLAAKYLDITEQYMNMYQKLIGPYPYTKFALVENFWETGYGMPSFTLLGEKIIRFPFILYSSYPHELLHNWWGNSVYVDFDKGNWCEGITAYQADHLISEQRGQGDEYRRTTLQKFTNVVDNDNDFPLREFISRHDAASEAIGYGKSLMMWHMLRRELGDDLFNKGFAHFNKTFSFKTASFDNIRAAFETVTGTDLSAFFNQWLNRTGAPEIDILSAVPVVDESVYTLKLKLIQKQKDPAFNMGIPIVVATAEGLENHVVTMSQKQQEFILHLKHDPLKMAVDPQFDVFRLLDAMEVPPTWSKVLAARENLMVLPSKAGETQKQVYEEFVKQWKTADNDTFEVVYDNNLNELPIDKTCWILGFENVFADRVDKAIAATRSSVSGDSVIFEQKAVAKANHSFVLTVYNQNNNDVNLAFVALDNAAAIPGLVRKLPHYGKYSYLGFEGEEPVNIAKGEWPVLDSPLIWIFDDKSGKIPMVQERAPLVTLDPVYSENRMIEHINVLSSEKLQGRGLASPGLDAAADYIAAQFVANGLQPMGNAYFQEFTQEVPGKGSVNLKNVVAIIPGTDPILSQSPVVLSAHYDHLGLGWPDVHTGNQGIIHPGADDNASGVSILLEVARNLAKTLQPKRTVIFVAFTGEEAGLLGSRYFVGNLKKHYSGNVLANVNLDTDGSLFDRKLLVLNGNSAKEWKFVFMGTDYTTGVKTDVIQQELDASDQVAFIEKGVPAVQLFTGATPNYHRPSDTYDKIDGKGLVKVAAVSREVMAYLAERETPFEFTAGKPTSIKAQTSTSNAPKTTRKASTGSVPDFAYTGEGVKIGSVVEGSPAANANLLTGDIIVSINGEAIKSLMDYSNALKKYQPGDTVQIGYTRNEKLETTKVVLGER